MWNFIFLHTPSPPSTSPIIAAIFMTHGRNCSWNMNGVRDFNTRLYKASPHARKRIMDTMISRPSTAIRDVY
ncbi:hypothetical protein OUZ56_015511 [Daphnia magna]|uniref:Secreted protein n=1 Tax=Daphnia magna TaxID=35525 RepID=A0ABR0AN63_9CRUS|nr:hypothetical protein OUZ56_015511 [Daphnia magna]